MKLFVREAADADLEEIAAYIGQDSAAAAASILKSVRAAFEAVATPPKAWTTPSLQGSSPENARVLPVPRYRNYLIIYRATDEMVEILRVLHEARDLESAVTREPPG